MNRRRFTSAALAAATVAGCRGDVAFSLIGQGLPRVRGVLVTGEVLDFATMPVPALIRFWGLGCRPCMADQPLWERLVRRLRAEPALYGDPTIVSVHVGTQGGTRLELERWAKAQPADSATPIVDDVTGALARAFGVPGTPSTLLVGTDRTIIEHAWQFQNDRGVDTFLKKIRDLVGDKP